MGTAACSQTLKAVGCSQLAIVLRGMNREERQAMDEESDHSVDTFREHMRRQAGLPDLDDLRAEEAEEKRRVVLERSRPSKQQRPKGDPLQLARPGSTLASRVAAAVSTGLERQDADFAVKTCHVAGTPSLETLADDFGASIRSERGRLPEWQRPNQDEALFVLLRDGYRIGVVVDGHGPDGHSVAHVVRDFLFRRLASSLPSKRSDSLDDYRIGMYQLLAETLQDADQLLFSGQEAADARASGATTCVTIHDQKKRWIFSAWVGNCRCVLGEFVEEGAALEVQGRRRNSMVSEGTSSSGTKGRRRKNPITFSSSRLTEDHLLSSADERVRIASTGAVIATGPLGLDEVSIIGRPKFPGIHFSRCLGDLVARQLGVSAEPEVNDRPAEQVVGDNHVKIRYVIMGTDGLWQFMKEQAAAEAVTTAARANVQYAAGSLVQRARESWDAQQERLCDFIDDITCLTFWL
ncbi:unnamed protein product [Effrenium voratum]|uniref:PPM-type phosphatase domain-containing protein n=1 Tax=Effrenium voratum TaxID=2562239 RepID=A0AA36JQP1_9DINO|nr:unnamed protein product [Effrenium voratum]